MFLDIVIFQTVKSHFEIVQKLILQFFSASLSSAVHLWMSTPILYVNKSKESLINFKEMLF